MPSFENDLLSACNHVSLAEAALAYAAAGLPIFPLRPRAKQPMVQGGFKRATTNAFLIRRWWRETPLANIGVACGEPSGWWVLDIDPRHEGLVSLAHIQQEVDRTATPGTFATLLISTLRQLTGGGGVHVLFQRRDDLVGRVTTTTNWAGYTGIDIRAEGSYILVAPSVHPHGGVYQWQNDLPLIPFPDELVTLGEARRARQRWSSVAFARSTRPRDPQPFGRKAPRVYLRYALSQATVGQRNRFACYLACRLVEDVGLDWPQAVPWMCEFVAHVSQTDHPYTEREALSALAWAFQHLQAA